MLLRDYGMRVSASTVGRTIARHGLFFADTKAHEQKRAAANVSAFNRVPSDPTGESAGASAFPILPDPIAS
jgi:hypothetical protein